MVTACLLLMNNYEKKFLNEVNSLEEKKSLCIHVCCGPCSVYPLILLSKYFKITIYYGNSNIYPFAEYQKRLATLEEYLRLKEFDIDVVVPKYDVEYQKKLAKYAHVKEGKERCCLCYAMRMRDAYLYAKEHHFDYFTSVMSISNHKNANYINRIGENLEAEIGGVKYLYADFKKSGGIDKNRELNDEINLYHQDYCGCVFSLRDYLKKTKGITK